ncbi:armadillo repeat-containing protein 3-like isoform X2 [Anticarsia gemmatalis]|uniref:armadillo repeat-containing protein 3-like isoform X2 n=1 Tax=Anticarsia gemmatalis TaxID=129554 RepID=UPI003F766FFF
MAKPLQKERENRSADKKDTSFHPYTISPESAHTSILLLESAEPEILCQTLRAITKFSAQEIQNRYVLFNLNAIKYILQHVEHSELNIRRFALKALAQLCQLPRGPEQVLTNAQNLRKIALMLAKNEDVFVLEFASLVLAELTREPLGCEQLISVNILGSLFSRMKNSLDPDVQKNCLQTLSNLLDDPVCASEVTKNQQFSWPSLLALMQSKFLAIQHAALRTVDQLICRYKDQNVQKTFRASTGVLDLCDILESYEFRDVHTQVLGVLRNYVETEENASHLFQSGCILRLLAYLEMALPAMKPGCLAVLTKMSFNVNGRDALYETGTDLVFCHQLLSSNVELLADAAMGVANMTKLLPAAIRMSDTNIIEALCAILGDDAAVWFYIRINALRALAELCRIIPKAAFSLVEPKTFASLRNINKKFKDTPIEAQRLAVQVYINLQNYHVSTKAMLNPDFMQELLNILQRIDISLKIMTCSVLTGLMAHDAAKDLFNSRKGEAVVSENLHIEHVGLRTALCILITSSVIDEGSDAYLELGTIHYMVENRQARYVVGAWEPALETIFKHHPSAKLAYTGRLDINDFTSEGFYCLKRLGKRFPTLQDVNATPILRNNPVFICMFNQPDWESASAIDVGNVHEKSESVLGTNPSKRFPTLPEDVNLRTHLLKLKMWFGDPSKSLHYIEMENAHYEVRYRDKCDEVSTSLKQRAQMLAEYVAEQMSGLTQEKDCSMPSVDLHLADLMVELNSPIIGIGWVKCGGSLERAILYKALADRLGLPCALHRATSAYAWCEVAVPEIETEEDKDVVENYPAGLLRANYVVDLTVRPGRLLPREGREARLTCGPKCAPPYTAGGRPEVCLCENMGHTGCQNNDKKKKLIIDSQMIGYKSY